MRNALAVARRELNSAFLSSLAYTVLTLFLLFSGFFGFYSSAVRAHEATYEDTIAIISFFFLFGTPLLTMRLLSEEYRNGTIETLMTAPVSDGEVVFGKFLGALAFYLFMLAPTLVYVAVLCALGRPDGGAILSGYVGIVALGCDYIALGLFCSALTRYQIVAGVLALMALLALWVIGVVAEYMPYALRSAVEYLGTWEHFRPFSVGRIAFRDLFYFFSMTCFWLFLAVRALESRRWR